jgi:hypothetical protein
VKTYDSVIDLLNHEGPGLADYIPAEQLDQLIDGTLAPAAVADEYLADLADSTLVAVSTDEATTRADLLTWIRWEIEANVEHRKEEAREAQQQVKLDTIRKLTNLEERLAGFIHFRKIEIAREALELKVPKAAIADAAGISRPTLDKWLNRD